MANFGKGANSGNYKHGHAHGCRASVIGQSVEYMIWAAMIQRCGNPKNKGYRNYGGCGVKVCDRWRSSFSDFLNDMGNKPEGMSIDRIDSYGDYEPSNCRWLPLPEQSKNRRNSIIIEYHGTTKRLKDWCSELGLRYDTTIFRYHRNYPVEWILSEHTIFKLRRMAKLKVREIERTIEN